MEKISYDNGGCMLTWNVENFPCLRPLTTTSSPVFNIEANKRTQWIFELYKCKECRFNLFLRRCDIDTSKVTISYTCLLMPEYMQKGQASGLHTFAKLSNDCICFSEQVNINKAPKRVTIQLYLRVVEEQNFVTNHYRFRNVVEGEHRRFKYAIPNISTWKTIENQKLYISFPQANNATEPFRIELSAPETGDLECVCVEFFYIKAHKSGGTYLWCKLSAFDGESNPILSATNDYEFLRENEKGHFPNKINIENLNQNCTQDILTIEFDILISEHKTSTWMEEFTSLTDYRSQLALDTLEKDDVSLRSDLMRLYVDRKCPDVEICVGSKKFSAHKAILSARSPVFMAMFENNMQEKEMNCVEISDLDSETVDKMLLFMYSENLQGKDWSNVTKLYAASDKYQIMTLKSKCLSILKEQLTPKNSCEALHLADMYYESDFLNIVQDFIVTHDEKVLHSEKWKEFMNYNPKIACQIVHKAWVHRSNRL